MRAPFHPTCLLLVLLLSSCRPGPPKNPATRAPLPTPAEALESLRVQGKLRTNLRALGRVTYFGESGRVRLQAVIVAQRPGRFRFETLSPLEQPLDVMASDGERLWLLSKEKLSEGPATPENIARLLPLPMEPEEVVDTLLGGVPTSPRLTPATLAWEQPDERRWVLTLDGLGSETLRLLVDPARKVVEKVEVVEPSGGVRIGVTFDDFERAPHDMGEIPRELRILMPSRNLDVAIKLKEVDVNVELSEALFRIQAPPGIEVERLDSPPVPLPDSPAGAE